MDVYSENSYGVCVPVNSSANEVIIGLTRASALQNSGASGKSVFSFLETVEHVCPSLHESIQPHRPRLDCMVLRAQHAYLFSSSPMETCRQKEVIKGLGMK